MNVDAVYGKARMVAEQAGTFLPFVALEYADGRIKVLSVPVLLTDANLETKLARLAKLGAQEAVKHPSPTVAYVFEPITFERGGVRRLLGMVSGRALFGVAYEADVRTIIQMGNETMYERDYEMVYRDDEMLNAFIEAYREAQCAEASS